MRISASGIEPCSTAFCTASSTASATSARSESRQPASRSWAKIHSRAQSAASGDAATRDVRVEREDRAGRVGVMVLLSVRVTSDGVLPGCRAATRFSVAWNGIRGRR